MKTFKTLVFKGTDKFAHPVYDEWGEGENPFILANTATIEGVKMFFPKLNIDEVEIIDICYQLQSKGRE